MSSKRLTSATIRMAALAAVGVTALSGLSACEERPYSVPVRTATYVPPRSTDLDGAPEAPPESQTPPAYGEPAATPPPTYAEAPPTYAPPPPQTYRPAPSYDTGGPMIVAMAPIPNPEPDHEARRWRRHGAWTSTPHHHAKAESRHPVWASRHSHTARGVGAPVRPGHPRHAMHHARKPMTATSASSTHSSARAGHGLAPAGEKPVNVTRNAAAAHLATTTKTNTSHAATKANAARKHSRKNADNTTKLAALQAALSDAVAKSAVLTTPAQFVANRPSDVSLTLPAAFAETLRAEAEKQGLSDAAASVNMTSVLAGPGFAVTPDDTQSQPLTVGQPTQFHWTVTAQPGARGPLHADVGADLLGGGSQTLSLGSIQKAAGLQRKMTPSLLLAGVLALIVVLVLGWLARSPATASRTAPVRRTETRPPEATGEGRPLDPPSEDTRL